MFNVIKNKIKSLLGYKYLVDNNKKLNELVWAEVFNSSISNVNWLKNKSFSPGRWAIGYPSLYILFRVLNDMKPINILEFGLGESTKLTGQYIDYQKKNNINVTLNVIEHDENWRDFFCSKPDCDFRDHVSILELDKIKNNGFETTSYKNLTETILSLNSNNRISYDLIFIDGPFGSDNYSRNQIIDIVKNDLLAKEFVILFDDSEREGERETINELKKTLENKNIEYCEGAYSGIKDICIICSNKYKFLTSL